MKLFIVICIIFIAAIMTPTSDASLCNIRCPAGFECLGFKCVVSDSGRFKRGNHQWDQIPCQSDKDCPGSFCVGGFCYTGGK